MEKEKRYEEIPNFDQETQYIIQKDPVDMGDYIFVGVEIKDMDAAETTEQVTI